MGALATRARALRITSYELRVTSYELRVTSYELRVASYELRVTSYELRVEGRAEQSIRVEPPGGKRRLTHMTTSCTLTLSVPPDIVPISFSPSRMWGTEPALVRVRRDTSVGLGWGDAASVCMTASQCAQGAPEPSVHVLTALGIALHGIAKMCAAGRCFGSSRRKHRELCGYAQP